MENVKRGRGRPAKKSAGDQNSASAAEHFRKTSKAAPATATDAALPSSAAAAVAEFMVVEPATATTAPAAMPPYDAPAKLAKRRNVTELVRESFEALPISAEVQARVYAQVGPAVGEKVVQLSKGSLARLCAYMTAFGRFQSEHPGVPIPEHWHTDAYWDLSPEQRVEMLDAAFKIHDDDAELKTVVEGEFTCRACKGRRVLVKLRQIRSGDEAMSQFFTCADCKKKWVIH